ncbi:MAG: hypothetical protein QXR19_07030 [Candidatus Jordarchaeaceae archaeon]
MNPNFAVRDREYEKRGGNDSEPNLRSGKSGALRAADLVSKVITPQLVGVVVVLIFSFLSPIGTGPRLNSLECFLIGIVFIVVLPISPVLVAYALGKVDIWVSSREARTPYFVWAIFMYAVGTLIFFFAESIAMYAISLTYVFVTLSVTLINLKWKISIHAAGISGPSTALAYVFGILALPTLFFILLVIWARTKLKAHTLGQSVAGAIVAVPIALGSYALAYPTWNPVFWFTALLHNFLALF